MSATIIPFKRPPAPPPDRFVVATRRGRGRPRVLSAHKTVRDAGLCLAAQLYTEEPFAGWTGLYDLTRGKPGDLAALVIRVEHKRQRGCAAS